VLLHVVTKKGKGFEPAELDATGYHGVSASNGRKRKRETFTAAFSRTMVEMASEDDRVVAITAGMPDGTGLDRFAAEYPDRFFDVGIAEQHAVTLACGLAFSGLRPVTAIYSTFLQRALDQVIHDAALQSAPIILALDRGGVVGEDGPTHHGVFDISMLLPLPNIRIGAPRNCAMLELLLRRAVQFEENPTAIRYPRGEEPAAEFQNPLSAEPGIGQLLMEGNDVLIIGVGIMALVASQAAVLLAADNVSAAVYDPIWLKPAPIEEIRSLAEACGRVVIVEDGSVTGGFGSFISSHLHGESVLEIGIPDEFQPHATREELMRRMGLDPRALAERIGDFVGS